MKPGEYVGADGRRYRWVCSDGKYEVCWVRPECANDPVDGLWGTSIHAEDWPAAKTALDALIEAEAGEWVYVDKWARIRADGSSAEERYGSSPDCLSWGGYVGRWADAYRKGREVALEQVKELVEAVLASHSCYESGPHGGWMCTGEPVLPSWLTRVLEAAKKLKS